MVIVEYKQGEAFPGRMGGTMGFGPAGVLRSPDKRAESWRVCSRGPAS
jgi:hypothetical protein